jgi:hypothetical protein
MSNIDKDLENIQKQIHALVEENNKLVAKKAEEEAAKKKVKSKEQIELVKLRDTIKRFVDSFNEIAKAHKIDVSVGLLTLGGQNIYDVDEDGETADGEYFSNDEYDSSGNYNQYGIRGWFPSSMSC